MALGSSSFQEIRPAVVPDAAPRLSGITRQNLSDQPVREYDEHKARRGRRSKPSTSLEPSVGGAALSRTNEYASLPSRRPENSLADTFMYMFDNPFADAAPSGDTPSSATREDPIHDVMKYSHVVTAEHKPRVARVSGINGAWPERAEIVNPSRGFPAPTIPRGTFSQAKAFFLKLSASGGYLQGAISQRTRSQDNPIKDKDSIGDQVKVDVPRARSANGRIMCDPSSW
ncbi:hypothetical protein DFJ58DRAFT_751969 [Suillus subalutaceus]|uniref:uncharacterized protein n=1 Tax=Suillus subalutaceus TaxID=48586 RepID=UPI001B865B87|nr:uncharacterized protein DFJ58DRAFT_751969 [Suillus subalutaceus]KAG1877610.1 hypothetical protein DFJ58DRAFT_751969 [Suillus subalutaceus]